MANRRDVAEFAQVSTATVSNVLNNKKYVSSEVRNKVLVAAEALNYRPTLNKSQRSNTRRHEVVFVVNDISNPHHAKIMEGMDEVAMKNDFVVSMMAVWQNVDEFCLMLIERGIDAVFFSTFHHEISDRHFEMLRNAGIIVMNSWDNFVLNFDNMFIKAIRYLSDLGHHRIAYLSGISITDHSNIRYAAYKKAIQECSMDDDPELSIDGIYPYETTVQSGYWAMKTAIESDISFTAVIALNDLMAMGAMKAINEKGLQIPEDISVMGCDDIVMSEYIIPPLTTLKIPAFEIGKRTMYDIIQMKKGKKIIPVHMDIELIIRKSTGRVN